MSIEQIILNDISQDATWISSSSKQDCDIGYANDNKPYTFWQSNGKQPHWVVLRFQRNVFFSRIEILNSQDPDISYTLKNCVVSIGKSLRSSEVKIITSFENNLVLEWINVNLEPCENPSALYGNFIKFEFPQCYNDGKDMKLYIMRVYENLNWRKMYTKEEESFESSDFTKYMQIR